jgi:hypothetical protein
MDLIPLHSQMNPDHNFRPYFSNIQCNIILPPMPRSTEWFLSFRFSYQNFISPMQNKYGITKENPAALAGHSVNQKVSKLVRYKMFS